MIFIRSENGELVSRDGEYKLRTHEANAECYFWGCAIHSPTPTHHINIEEWPYEWRGKLERICPHGIGHPDPDAVDWEIRHTGRFVDGHGCDGCCYAG